MLGPRKTRKARNKAKNCSSTGGHFFEYFRAFRVFRGQIIFSQMNKHAQKGSL